jgi:hypothetical protein
MRNLVAWTVTLTLALTGCNAYTTNQEENILKLEAEEIARFEAREAGQGAAVDAEHFYAIVNSAIGKYDKQTGERVAGWSLDREGPLRHINSCYVSDGRLLCANSNFPEVPMASSIEIIDTATMQHVETRSLGMDFGSLTWFDWRDGCWWAGFAHYNGRGGETGKDHRYTNVVKFDDEWRKLEQWMFPDSVLERFAPHSTSGGAFGPDGLFYVTGHDRKEMYVLRLPTMGPKLVHVATIEIDIEGQAFAWDRSTERRVVYAISGANREVRAFEIPAVQLER